MSKQRISRLLAHRSASVALILLLAAPLSLNPKAARAESGVGASALSAGSSFNSSFNGTHTGWSKITGPWTQTPKYFTTAGINSNASSVRHSGTYRNFVMSARLKRTGSSTTDLNVLIVRGNPTAPAPWSTSYIFGYTEGGAWRVSRYSSNVESVLAAGAGFPVVSGPNWNVLKVVFYGPSYLFYINGNLVSNGSDANITKGAVGIAMYRAGGSTGNKLLIDWAKLSVISADPNLAPSLSLDGMDQIR